MASVIVLFDVEWQWDEIYFWGGLSRSTGSNCTVGRAAATQFAVY